MRHFYPDKNSVRLLQIIISAIGFILFLTAKHYIHSKSTLLILGTIIVSLCTFIMFIYLPLYFSSLKYIVTDTEIIRTGGVFIKVHQSVLFSSIQYVTVVKTFLSGYTGLNFIIFFVFGGRFRLMFLSRNDIDEILRLSGTVYRKEK
ncbi:MAG: PH domain-containing protein [Ruminococcus sp.]|nr:PH domain-containing protein [Ruminococcus sp.]